MTALTLIGPKGQIEYLIGALHVYRCLSFSFTLTILFTTSSPSRAAAAHSCSCGPFVVVALPISHPFQPCSRPSQA